MYSDFFCMSLYNVFLFVYSNIFIYSFTEIFHGLNKIWQQTSENRMPEKRTSA